MMNDTVREELQTKIAPSNSGRLASPEKRPTPLPPTVPVARPTFTAPPAMQTITEKPRTEARPKISPTPPIQSAPANTPPPVRPATATVPAPPPSRTTTSELNVKKTSQTLVGFQAKNSTMPDWRLQLQNTVRQRAGTPARPQVTDQDAVAASQTRLVTSGANALKAEPAVAPPAPSSHSNPRVANALKRIEDSRQAFLANTVASPAASAAKPTARSYPFNVIARAPQPARVQPAQTESTSAKPRLVSSLRIEKKGLDTNKLPPLPQTASVAADIDEFSIAAYDNIVPPSTFVESDRLAVRHADPEVEIERSDELEIEEIETDEIDDLAPFSMRFGAGLFDFIIGAFATAVLMSPVILSGGNWMSFSGALAFTAALAIVLFVYLTGSIGFLGRTFGMRLFSLEMIDAEENAYPTLHQAAVSSSVYLVSIALGGLGFVPALFNEERRAMHDILSGTILIREV